MPQPSRSRVTLLAAVALAAAVTGGATSLAQESAAPEETPVPWFPAATGVTGNVDVHGSSTVAPISQAVAEAFQVINPEWSFFVGDEGTGAGFDDFFCVGDADISDASRAIDEEEVASCQAAGVEFVELKVAYDGLAVITNAQNTALDCVTTADLYALFGPESNGVANWKDAQALATELGSSTVFPDAPLSITAPGDESGTYDSFIELALGDFIEARGQEEKLRDPGDIYVASPNDNIIIQGVAGFPTSLGFVGLHYAEQNLDTVRILAVDGGEGCVAPDLTTVSEGTYSISRPLFIYPSLTRAAENPAIQAYVDYYLSDEGLQNVSGQGYVPMHLSELNQTRLAWLAATGR
jgi:phosphate transport system substrate-binding protein